MASWAAQTSWYAARMSLSAWIRILELPLPRTEAGARQFRVALDAHARRECWGSRRRVATVAAAFGSLPVILDRALGLGGPTLHHASVALWATALGAMAVSTAAIWWWDACLERALEAIGGRVRSC